jgi:N-acetylglucosaminyl-diphospho-decaprenol L-rhamnosyltransferase
VKVSAVVVSHGHARELEESLPALTPQVDELLVIANVPGSAPDGVEALVNERPLGYAANLNRGLSRTSGDALLASNPDAVAAPGAVAALRDFMAAHPRCGVAGPRMVFPDGSPQPSRRRFPTVAGTVVRRTPLRKVVPQRRHFHAGESQPDEPVQADWMLGGFLLLRRAMLEELGGFDEGFRLYGEDIDLQYRAMRAGWERWYVPAATVRHEHKAVTDKRWLTRRTLWHWAGIARFVRKHPETLKALV